MQKHRFIRDARLEKINANRFYPKGMTYKEAVGIVKQIVRAQMTRSFDTNQERVGDFTFGEIDQAIKIIERGYTDE
tara:strand:- start:702 stop:929 length:228 start_codon:yes stop_codon:yes gene_type:complete